MYLLIKALALPPANLVLLLMVGLVLRVRFRRTGTVLALAGALGLYALSTPFAATRLLAALERAVPAPSAAQNPPRAIVILAAGFTYETPAYDAETVDGLTLERLRRGVRLQRRSGLPILVTGGPSRRSVSTMAALMRKSLREDFATFAAWVEGRSASTWENALFSARILRREGIGSVYVVSQAWHLPRALAAFEAAGLTAVPAATGYLRPARLEAGSFVPSAKAIHQSYYAAHEWLGLFWYRRTLFGNG